MAVSVRHLVGREDELAALVDLLDAPADGLAAAAVVGDAGIGKTTLWLAAIERAEASSSLVLSCRPSEAEAHFSFVGLADLIGGVVDEVLPELPRPQRRALETALALSDSDGAPADDGIVAFAFLNTLRSLAATHRLVLAIDDVQWLDEPSAAMLRFALLRLAREPIVVVLTARGAAPAWLQKALPAERFQTIELAALSVGALHELLRSRVGTALPRPALLRIWEASGGNPFFALELASALERRGGRIDPGAELPIPANLEDLVHERLDRLGAAGLEVARVVAALASPTIGVVEVAAGRRAERGLSRALDARILEVDGDRLRFTHPLLRSGVSSRAAPAVWRSLHARLAMLVPGEEERARHLALATPEPSRAVAAVVEEAAESVHARGAAAAAAELAELAVRLTPVEDAADLRRRTLDCADRHREAGDGRRAIAQLEQVCSSAPPGVTRAAALVRLARTVSQVVGPQEAIRLYRQALAEAEGDDALEAEIHLRLAEDVADAEDRHRGLMHAQLAVEAAARVADPELRCRALATSGFLHFREGQGVPKGQMEEALALERSLAQWPRIAPATEALALQLVWSGEGERGRNVIQEWREALHAQDDPQEEKALWLLAMLEWRAGNWDLGATHAADTLVLRAQFGREGSQPIAELPAAMIAAHQGRIEEARDRSERALSLAKSDGVRIAQSGHRCVLGFIELSRGDPAAALGYLERAWEIRDRVRLFEPAWRLELADTVEALIEVGRLDDAERNLIPWEERSLALDRSWALAVTARCRGLLLAAQGDLAGAVESYERALRQHKRTRDPFQHARTLLAFGVTQRRAKQRGAARVTLEHALAVFERIGAPLWAAKARAEAARIGGRAPSRGALTEGERRITALVAEGRTNRDVAATLFITEHTVEAALTRAYRKLGVHSRAELAHRLNRKL
jgi:DNA-binding CsgD family transcriptional regulator/predicted negative regulator of RcsB-dependent stress response